MRRPIPEVLPGIFNDLQVGMVVLLWWVRQPSAPRVEQVQGEFGVSRATAYRWMRAVRDVIEREQAAGRAVELPR